MRYVVSSTALQESTLLYIVTERRKRKEIPSASHLDREDKWWKTQRGCIDFHLHSKAPDMAPRNAKMIKGRSFISIDISDDGVGMIL